MTSARTLVSLVAAGWTLFAGAASAQNYPNRPITLVVPLPPGGATDAIARILADRCRTILGQQIVIETVGGAGGMIASARVARAAPDGYTILLHQVGACRRHDALSRIRRSMPRRTRRASASSTPRLDHRGAPDTAAQQHGRAGEVAEGARPERQGRACRCRLVRPSVWGAVRPGGRREGRPDPLSRRRTGAQRSGRGPCRSELACRPWSPRRRSTAATSRSMASSTRSDTPGCRILPTMGEAGYKKIDLDLLAHPVRAGRHAEAYHRPAEPSAAPRARRCQGQEGVRQERAWTSIPPTKRRRRSPARC